MKRFYTIFVSLVILILLSGLALAFLMVPRGEEVATTTKKEEVNKEPRKINVFNQNKDPINVLMIGLDSSKVTYEVDENSKRADTLMLLTIDPKKNKAHIISIPRDTYYKLKGYDNYKINAGYSRGGLELQISSVEDFMDCKIAIGGVEIYTPEYSYKDPSTIPPLEINFHEGVHNLNGEDAVKYLRIRKYYEDQDIGRIHAQQGFIMKVFEKLKNPSTIFKLPKLVSIANRYVKTDFSYGQLSYLAYYAMSLEKDDIEFNTLQGQRKVLNNIDYYKVDKDYARGVLKEFLNREENEENLTEEELEKKKENEKARSQLNFESQ